MREQPAKPASIEADWLPPGESLPVHIIAKALGVHRKHIVDLVEQGSLVAYDLRGAGSSRSCLRIPREALVQLLRERKIIADPGKRATKHARIAPTKSRRRPDPASELLAVLRAS